MPHVQSVSISCWHYLLFLQNISLDDGSGFLIAPVASTYTPQKADLNIATCRMFLKLTTDGAPS